MSEAVEETEVIDPFRFIMVGFVNYKSENSINSYVRSYDSRIFFSRVKNDLTRLKCMALNAIELNGVTFECKPARFCWGYEDNSTTSFEYCKLTVEGSIDYHKFDTAEEMILSIFNEIKGS